MAVEKEKPRPPYAKYAFKNPYNLSLLLGAGAAAAATGNWWLAIAGAGMEALWMLFAPDSKLLRKLAWDKRWEKRARGRAARRARRKVQAAARRRRDALPGAA
jgi:hypothetical protein